MASFRRKVEEVIPAAGRTIRSLRDIGYELPQAVADLVDNSVEAKATEIRIDVRFDGTDSWIRIADNGHGMGPALITESLRIGSVRDYRDDDLGKFGFGLKTASISQCRRVLIASRSASRRRRIEARVFDLEHIEQANKWEIQVLDQADRPIELVEPLRDTTGTVVLWQCIDRVLAYRDPDGNWAHRKLLEQTELVAQHLGMVFHRFLSGETRDQRRISIFVNSSAVEPWDPFCLSEKTTVLESRSFKIASGGAQGIATLRPYVLPSQVEFSDNNAWNRASGPSKWNNQQGLYIYRADRLIQWGGWSRLRTVDEHTKLARVALDFAPDLDSAFGINISKAVVKLPAELREEIQPVISFVCKTAEGRYRNGAGSRRGAARPPVPPLNPRKSAPSPPSQAPDASGGPSPRPRHGGSSESSTQPGAPVPQPVVRPTSPREALEQAAAEAGEQSALTRIMSNLQRISPEVARELGW